MSMAVRLNNIVMTLVRAISAEQWVVKTQLKCAQWRMEGDRIERMIRDESLKEI